MEQRELTFELLFMDYLKFNRWYNRKYKFYYLLFVIIGFVITIFLFDSKSKGVIIGNILLYFILYFVLLGTLYLYIYFKSKKIFRTDKDMNSERKIVISNQFISKTSKYEILNMEWKELYKLVKFRGDIYFMIADNKGIILPGRFIDGKINHEIFEHYGEEKSRSII